MVCADNRDRDAVANARQSLKRDLRELPLTMQVWKTETVTAKRTHSCATVRREDSAILSPNLNRHEHSL
jgi:hypothetical protein